MKRIFLWLQHAMIYFLGEINMFEFLMGKTVKINFRVFDWDKAAELILQRSPQMAHAGLIEDWGATSALIYDKGKPRLEEDFYEKPYLMSDWAMPVLVIGEERIQCWRWQHELPEDNMWDAFTNWPQSALDIVSGRVAIIDSTFAPPKLKGAE